MMNFIRNEWIWSRPINSKLKLRKRLRWNKKDRDKSLKMYLEKFK